MIQVGRIVNTPVIDHLIISDKSYVSFGNMGLMDELAKSIKYVPPYELVDKIRAEASETAKKEEKIEIAKELKRRAMSIDAIVEITGLTIEEINALRVRKHK